MGLSNANTGEESNCKHFLDPFDFCTMEEIENNKRFQLLQLRNQDISQYQHLKMIPADEEDLCEEMLEVYYHFINL